MDAINISITGRTLTIVDHTTLIMKCEDNISIKTLGSRPEFHVLPATPPNGTLNLEEVNRLCCGIIPGTIFDVCYRRPVLFTDFVRFRYFIFVDNNGIYVKKLEYNKAAPSIFLGNTNRNIFSEKDFIYFGSLTKSAKI